MRTKLALMVATWFGCGYAPIAPGTAGSLGALLPAWLLSHYAGWPVYIWPIAALGITVPAMWVAGVAATHAGRKDPGLVVVDEVAGQWLTLAGAQTFSWRVALAAFVLFRVFDIWKPPPVRQLERLPGGTGIVADDLMAGVYAALVLWAASVFLPASLQ
jgi:phosphatidylglycerophosphatase A